MSKSVGSNLIYNILRNVTNIIFPIVTAPYIARVLGPDCLGLVNFANSYVGYYVLFAALGIPNYGIREVANRRNDKDALSRIFSELFSINILAAIIASTIFLLTILLIDQLRVEYIIFLISGITLFTSPFSIDWFFSGLEEFKYITLRSIIVKTISVICLFAFVHNTEDLYIYVLLGALSGCLNQFWNLLALRRKGIVVKLTINGYRKHLKPLILLFSSTIAVSLYTTINTVMLGFMSTYDEVSFYNQANQLSRILLAVVTSMSEVMVPRLSFLCKNKDWNTINDLVKKSFSVVSLLAFPLAIGLIMCAPIFIPLFLGEGFYGSVVPLQIISLIIIIIGLNNITTVQILIGCGLDSNLLKTVLWGTFSNLFLNCILIPYWGAIGAAVSSVVAELLILIVSAIYVIHNTKIRYNDFGDLIKSLLGALLFIPIYYIFSGFIQGWLCLILYILVCALSYCIAQVLLKNTSFYIAKAYITQKYRFK